MAIKTGGVLSSGPFWVAFVKGGLGWGRVGGRSAGGGGGGSRGE